MLRQMRDLRRYVLPVVIQNAGQVHVADSGQQVNVQNKRKKKKPVRRVLNKEND